MAVNKRTIWISDHTSGKKYRVAVPANVPIKQLVPHVVKALNLPSEGAGGGLQEYYAILEADDTHDRIGENDTLAEAGVQDGMTIRIMPVLDLTTRHATSSRISRRATSLILSELLKEEQLSPREYPFYSSSIEQRIQLIEDKLTRVIEAIAGLSPLIITDLTSTQASDQIEDKLARVIEAITGLPPLVVTDLTPTQASDQDDIPVTLLPGGNDVQIANALIRLHIQDELEDFGEAEQQTLIEAIAQFTGRPKEEIKLVSVIAGSVVITIITSEEVAKALVEEWIANADWIADQNITHIQVLWNINLSLSNYDGCQKDLNINIDYKLLFYIMNEACSGEEIDILCFLLGEHRELFTGGKSLRIVKLIEHFLSRNQLPQLLKELVRMRPDILQRISSHKTAA